MKSIFKLYAFLLIILVSVNTLFAQNAEDSTFVHLPEEVKEFNENIAGFLSKGDISLIEKYIVCRPLVV